MAPGCTGCPHRNLWAGRCVVNYMHRKLLLYLLPVPVALLAGGGNSWKDKPIPEWNEEDAKQLLDDSPWVKTIHPTVERSGNSGQRQRGMGRGGGIGLGIPGVGIGFPGGGRRYPGGGYPGGGGGYPGGGGGYPGTGTDDRKQANEPPELKLRWESALPVREAELKTKDNRAPTIEEKYYAIAIYGVPDRMLNGNDKSLADQLKKQASLKRDGKKDLKPASVEVLRKEDGPVIVYLFPRSNEITKQDRRIEFNATIERLQFTSAFYVDEMVWQGKLQL